MSDNWYQNYRHWTNILTPGTISNDINAINEVLDTQESNMPFMVMKTFMGYFDDEQLMQLRMKRDPHVIIAAAFAEKYKFMNHKLETDPNMLSETIMLINTESFTGMCNLFTHNHSQENLIFIEKLISAGLNINRRDEDKGRTILMVSMAGAYYKYYLSII